MEKLICRMSRVPPHALYILLPCPQTNFVYLVSACLAVFLQSADKLQRGSWNWVFNFRHGARG